MKRGTLLSHDGPTFSNRFAFSASLLAILLLWFNHKTSTQAELAMVAQVYFDGEYRIADGPWQQIVKGEHIPATQGDVTLRGEIHMLTPDGEYVGIYRGELPVAFYTNHINLTFYDGENEPWVIDMENPLYGTSACGVQWSAYVLSSEREEAIEIRIHNPHRYGNETAIEENITIARDDGNGNVILETMNGVIFEPNIEYMQYLNTIAYDEIPK